MSCTWFVVLTIARIVAFHWSDWRAARHALTVALQLLSTIIAYLILVACIAWYSPLTRHTLGSRLCIFSWSLDNATSIESSMCLHLDDLQFNTAPATLLGSYYARFTEWELWIAIGSRFCFLPNVIVNVHPPLLVNLKRVRLKKTERDHSREIICLACS